MMTLIPQLVLILFGLFFLYTGIISFRNPAGFGRSLSLETLGASGEVEIRAQYGGFFLAAALSQFAPFIGLVSTVSALIVSLTIFGGLIFGRVGAVVMGLNGERITKMIKSLFVIDAIGFIGAAGCLILVAPSA